jgi:hypothetical protein
MGMYIEQESPESVLSKSFSVSFFPHRPIIPDLIIVTRVPCTL